MDVETNITCDVGEWPSTADGFRALVTRHSPVVFRGAASPWIPAECQSPYSALNWLSSIVGHRVMPLTVGLPRDLGVFGSPMKRGTINKTGLSGPRLFREIAEDM